MEQEIMNTEEITEVTAEVAEEMVVGSGNGLKTVGKILIVGGAIYLAVKGGIKLVKWIGKKIKSKKNQKEEVIEVDYKDHEVSMEELETETEE